MQALCDLQSALLLQKYFEPGRWVARLVRVLLRKKPPGSQVDAASCAPAENQGSFRCFTSAPKRGRCFFLALLIGV